VGSIESVNRLREDVRVLCNWADTWQMKFNIEKCKVMHIGAMNLQEEYLMDGIKLEKVIEEEDLGVIISSNFKV
jgi:low affinity Fe/Cu permease